MPLELQEYSSMKPRHTIFPEMKLLEHFIGSASALLSAVCYSAENLLLFNVRRVAHPFFIVSCCSFIQTILVIALLLIMRQSITNIGRRLLGLVILAGFLGAMGHIGFALSIFSIGPGNATLIFYTEPIFTILLSAVFLKDIFRWTDVIFAIIAFSAVVIISIPTILDQSETAATHQNNYKFRMEGVGFALSGAVTSAGGLVAARKVTENNIGTSTISLSYSIQYFTLSATFCTIFQVWRVPEKAGDFALTFTAGFALFLAVILRFYAVDKEKPAAVSVILTSEVLMTYMGSYLFFSYPIRWTTYVSSILIMTSCVGVVYTHDRTMQDEERENILTDENDKR